MKKKITFYVLLLLLSSVQAGWSDPPLLERVISISLQNDRLDTALKKIAAQGKFTFSYNPAILETDKLILTTFTNKTIRQILDQLFNGTLQYKERGHYIILTPVKGSTSTKDPRLLSGYIMDETTGERLKNVSVYEPLTLSAAVTDAYGYFEIEIDDPMENISLVVNKANYTDTLITVSSEKKGLVNIPIKINTTKLTSLADSVGRKITRFWKTNVKKPQDVNMENIHDTLYRTTQFSLLPFIGTNHKLSGNVVNDFSFNILGGYSMGTSVMEFGGLFNINRSHVQYAQVGGLFNLNGGYTRGFQLAGLFNVNMAETNALQIAGGVNFNEGEAQGTQLSGLINLQLKESHGTQIAGLMNIAGEKISGAQVSGLINIARKVKGTQLGFLNIADSIQGVPIGFLSFVSHGYHQIEISADEIFYTNIAIRTGIRQFYNILSAGAKPQTFANDKTFWTFGYGIGTAPSLSKKLYLNFDFTANQIIEGKPMEATNMLNKLYVGLEVQATPKFALTLGTTVNGYLTDITYDQYPELFTGYQPHIIYNKTYSNNLNLKMWLGAKVGVRFF